MVFVKVFLLLMMKCAVVLILLAVCTAERASGSDPVTDQAIADLKHDDPDVRVHALRELMTSLDARIPDALLPLLGDEGNSIRRLAARAIGSRWWQIPARDRSKFVRALKRNLDKNEEETARQMTRRGIALLSGDYGKSEVVYPSPSGRWVVYERRHLPCIIDTENGSEELVGWEPEPSGALQFFSGAVWHSRRDLVALAVQNWRWPVVVWIWQPGSKLRRIEVPEVLALLSASGMRIDEGPQSDIGIIGWKDNSLLLEFSYYHPSEGDFKEVGFQWNSDTDELALADTKRSQ